MSEVKFTEGPWLAQPDGMGDITISAPGRGHLAIAAVVNGEFMAMGNRSEEHEANANLIAASPTMFAALESAQAALAMMIEPNSIEKTTLPVAFAQATEAEVRARAALARARGDQS